MTTVEHLEGKEFTRVHEMFFMVQLKFLLIDLIWVDIPPYIILFVFLNFYIS